MFSVTVMFCYVCHIKPHIFFKILFQKQFLFNFDEIFTNKSENICRLFSNIFYYSRFEHELHFFVYSIWSWSNIFRDSDLSYKVFWHLYNQIQSNIFNEKKVCIMHGSINVIILFVLEQQILDDSESTESIELSDTEVIICV